MYEMIYRLCMEVPEYNPAEEQLPANALMHRLGIPYDKVDYLFNYTKSRMRANMKTGVHKNLKADVKIVHNRNAMKLDWLSDQAATVQEIFMELTADTS